VVKDVKQAPITFSSLRFPIDRQNFDYTTLQCTLQYTITEQHFTSLWRPCFLLSTETYRNSVIILPDFSHHVILCDG
jgi:hypothetical protein